MPTICKTRRQKNNKGNQYDKDQRKVYNTERWRKLRDWKFIQNPLCELCLKEGTITPAEDVHHIRSFMSSDTPEARYQLAYDPENLMSLCKRHHQAIHNKRK